MNIRVQAVKLVLKIVVPVRVFEDEFFDVPIKNRSGAKRPKKPPRKASAVAGAFSFAKKKRRLSSALCVF